MKVVRAWAKGYADEAGLSTLRVAADADVDRAVREEFGYSAKVYDVVDEDAPRPKPPSPEEQAAREFAFRGDWS